MSAPPENCRYITVPADFVFHFLHIAGNAGKFAHISVNKFFGLSSVCSRSSLKSHDSHTVQDSEIQNLRLPSHAGGNLAGLNAKYLGGGPCMNILSPFKRFDHFFIFGNMSRDAEFKLRVIKRN